MASHYSKVIFELPSGPDDEPYVVATIDCDTCGKTEIRFHVKHVGTLLRVLSDAAKAIGDDGKSMTREEAEAKLDANFPAWKTDRVNKKQSN